jgi:hypothetical protein
MQIDRIVIFTTVYPNGLSFLHDFFDSLALQTDTDFDLWIGLDRIDIEDLKDYRLDRFRVTFVKRTDDESNISLRRRMLERIIDQYQAVIFVDSDDILAPARVSVSRARLKDYDVYGCAMKIINEDGADMHISFGIPPGTDIPALMPKFNIFGLSNTSYSTAMLRKCLPFPDDCVLLDWFLATRSWFNGARMYFDPEELMRYRQWSLNTARVVPPFTREQVLLSTERVSHHYHCVLNDIPEIPDAKRALFEKLEADIQLFYRSITGSPELFQEYMRVLNQLPPSHIWWVCVAHPGLEDIWRR